MEYFNDHFLPILAGISVLADVDVESYHMDIAFHHQTPQRQYIRGLVIVVISTTYITLEVHDSIKIKRWYAGHRLAS